MNNHVSDITDMDNIERVQQRNHKALHRGKDLLSEERLKEMYLPSVFYSNYRNELGNIIAVNNNLTRNGNLSVQKS